MDPIIKTFTSVINRLYGNQKIDDATYEELKKVFFTGFDICFELLTEKIAPEDSQRQIFKLGLLRDELQRYFKSIKEADEKDSN